MFGSLRRQIATGLADAEREEGLPAEAGEDIAASRRGRAATFLGRAVHAVLGQIRASQLRHHLASQELNLGDVAQVDDLEVETRGTRVTVAR